MADDKDARIARLEAALMPFADAMDRYDVEWDEQIGGPVLEPDDAVVSFLGATGEYVDMVTIGDLRRARAALRQPEKP